MAKKWMIVLAAFAAAGTAAAAQPAAHARITVDFSEELGSIKPMHAVNNGPLLPNFGGGQVRGNFEDFRSARIPLVRTHDSIGCVPGGEHTCDINAIFPDFDADETDPANYDFVFTDHYLDTIHRAGSEIFFRLGQTIEHGPKKYGILPPKDFAKWARICEHIVRHYNEGWGWGNDKSRWVKDVVWSNQFNIVYWEIWNEPDLCAHRTDPNALPVQYPCTWGGTANEFYRLYETTAKHLKEKFPSLKIGGPALSGGNKVWNEGFLKHCKQTSAPLDFFSWHSYTFDPARVAASCRSYRKLLDDNGFTQTESILNEWNYVRGWQSDWRYTLDVESGRFNQKGAAYLLSVMIECQSLPVDMLMFYDARATRLTMNNLFSHPNLLPMKGYYPFYLWSNLVEYGTQVPCKIVEGRGMKTFGENGVAPGSEMGKPVGSFRAVAAKNADGSGALAVARYSEDDNVSEVALVTLDLPGVDFSRLRCHLTDSVRTYTEFRLEKNADGTALLRLQPNSFAFVEWEGKRTK